VLPHHGNARELVVPARDLVKELRDPGEIAAQKPVLDSGNAGRSNRSP